MNESIPQQEIVRSDRTLETLCHLLGLAGYTGIPFANVLGPLVIWLWKRDGNPSVDAHGKEALNFQICFALYAIVAAFTFLILIGIILFPAVIIAHLVLTIIGSVKANRGEFYRYPLTFRIIN